MIMDDLSLGMIWYPVFLLSTTLHEAAHAYAAMLGGDLTGYHEGQVTLDPRPHIKREPFGMVLVPLFTFVTGGWMLGWASVPFDTRWADRFPHRAGWMSLAGPAANLFLVLVAGIGIHLGMTFDLFIRPESIDFSTVTSAVRGEYGFLAYGLSILFSLNLILFVFNLLPFPPLDGSGVILLFMKEETARKVQQMMHQPMLALGGFLIAWHFFGEIYGPFWTTALNVLYPGSGYH
jgi:Zn-dependent protease